MGVKFGIRRVTLRYLSSAGECTCEDGLELSCDYFDNFRCRDPTVPCFGGDTTDDSPYVFPTFDDYLVDDDDFARGSMSYSFAPDEVGEPLPAVDGAVEVGTKTEVAVSATAHDVRPGRATLERGCGAIGGDGCTAELSRDGISSDVESRWSCATKIVPGGGACQIEYTFAEPQDVVDIQVAFWKGNERARTLEVRASGDDKLCSAECLTVFEFRVCPGSVVRESIHRFSSPVLHYSCGGNNVGTVQG